MPEVESVPTVYAAFSSVMAEVQGIRKKQRNQDQGFMFRGIDAVLNTVGPKLREHGVIIVPTAEHIEIERYDTAKGRPMQGVIVRMKYTVIGPSGDSFEGSAFGQAADSGDKAVSKAESVAYRMFLLQALTIPTDEPDPDQFVHERGYPEPAPPPPNPLRTVEGRLWALTEGKGTEAERKKLVVDAIQVRGLKRDSIDDLAKLADEWDQDAAAAEHDVMGRTETEGAATPQAEPAQPEAVQS